MEAEANPVWPGNKRNINLSTPDHAQAIRLLFKNARVNKRNGLFNLEDLDEDEVMIRCHRDDVDNFLENFDGVKLQKELTMK